MVNITFSLNMFITFTVAIRIDVIYYFWGTKCDIFALASRNTDT